MATFEDFLNERNITLKRRYTEAYPAKTVGSSAKVRNAIIEALKDGKITVEEFNNIVSQHSSAPSKWTRGNKRFFKIEEDGVSLSKYGTKILNSLVTESTVNEKMSNAELKKISKTKEYAEISQAIRAGQSDYEDMYDMIDPKMFKGLDLKKFEEILDDWFNDEGMTYDSYADFARNAYSHHVAEITKLLMPFNESVDEGLNKSDERNLDEPAEMKNIKKFQKKYGTKTKVTTDNKPVGKRVTVYMEPGIEDGPDEIMEPQLKRHEEMMDFVKKHDLKISVADTVKGEWIFWTRYGVDESTVTEASSVSKSYINKFDKLAKQHNLKEVKPRKEKDITIIKSYSGKNQNVKITFDIYHQTDISQSSPNFADYLEVSFAFNDGNSVGSGNDSIHDWLDKNTWKDYFEDEVKESVVTEARVSAKKLLKSVVNGETNSVEGIKLSKGMARAFSDWLENSTYGRKFSKLPWDKLFTAAFNWGIERYAKSGELKGELKDLKTKAKAMKESNIYENFSEFVNQLESNEVTEGLNKSDVAYQLAIDYTGRTKPKITKLNKKRIQIKYGYKISPQKVIDSIKTVHPEVELKHVEWSNSMSGGGFHIFDILESNEVIEFQESFKLDESFTAKLTGIARTAKDLKEFIKMVFKHEKFKAFDTPKTQPDSYENFLNFIKGHYEMVQQYESNKIEENMIYTKFTDFVNESLEINEALKSSKLRGLLTMNKANKQLLKAIYGFSKIALDKITDDQIIDIDPKAGKKAEGLVVYYTTQEKKNPYADTSNYNSGVNIPANTILAMGMGKDVAYVEGIFDRYARKISYTLTTNPKKAKSDIGINKEYRGWNASGIYNVKRVIDVADAAFVINPNALPDTKGKIEDRIKAKEGAVSFKSDKEFKDANLARYKEILQKRASELPLDKLVMDAIDDATGVMKDGLKNQEKNKYGELIAGVGKDGRAYKLNDISNFISKLISDYERWSGYMKTIEDAEAKYGKDSREFKWEANYAQKEAQEYAKSIKDRLAKLKKRNLAW